MQKTANLIILMIIAIFFSTQTVVVSSSIESSILMEQQAKTYEKMLAYEKLVKEQAELQAMLVARMNSEKRMYDSLSHKISVKWLITGGFAQRQITIESSGNQHAISPEGAQGVAQFLPSTWEALKRHNLIPEWFVIGNEAHQRIAQLIYLDYLYKKWYDQPESDRKALMAASYNAGIGTVKNLVKTYGSEWRNYLPSETIKYLEKLKLYV